jgi:hypothetical protein
MSLIFNGVENLEGEWCHVIGDPANFVEQMNNVDQCHECHRCMTYHENHI